MIDVFSYLKKQNDYYNVSDFKICKALAPHYHEVPKNIKDNIEFRREIIRKCEYDDDEKIKIIRKCKEDVLFYVNTFVWTYSPKDSSEKPTVPFVTWPYQDYVFFRLLKSFAKEDIVIVKSRDIGATWICLAFLEWKWHFYDELSFLLVSRKEEYVDLRDTPRELFWKIDFIHKNQPAWMLPKLRGRKNDPNRKRKSLFNAITHSIIAGEATVEDIARGDRQTSIFIDEAAAIPHLDKVNAATRDATNCRIFVSTPKGHNEFESIVNLACEQDRLIVLHWTMHPTKSRGAYVYDRESDFVIRLDKNFNYADYQFIKDGKIRSPWYDEQESRATNKKELYQELDIDFHESSSPFFNNIEIQKLLEKCRTRKFKGFIDLDGNSMPYLIESDAGHFQMWIDAPRNDDMYTIGIDVAAGTSGDYSSNSIIAVCSVTEKEIVAELCANDIMIEELARVASIIAMYFNKAQIIWEANGYGISFGKYLMNVIGYYNIYMRRELKTIAERVTKTPGWWSSPREKKILLTNLGIGLRTEQLKVYSREFVKELSEYSYDPSGDIVHSRQKKNEGHGDRVIAVALAYKAACDYLFVKTPPRVEQVDSLYTYAYRKKLFKIKQEQEVW